MLKNIEVSSVGWLADIDRCGDAFTEMMKEAELLFDMASSVGSNAVEIINGPVDWHAVDCFRRGIPYDGYMGLQGLSRQEQRDITAKNMAISEQVSVGSLRCMSV